LASIAYALPVKDKDAGYKLIDELTGSKSDEHHEHLRGHGVDRIKVWQQHTPQEMVVIYVEGSNPGAALRDNSEMAKYLGGALEDISGHHPDKVHGGGPPSELLMDWHRDKGHSKGREHS
jgi:hypothetical protein